MRVGTEVEKVICWQRESELSTDMGWCSMPVLVSPATPAPANR
jgi:hypothetical protein